MVQAVDLQSRAATPNPPRPPIIQARGLTKQYRTGVLAVDGLTLTVERGQVYGFLGPNGAGKTTTLRMLVGLIRPTSGTATVCGYPPGTPAGLRQVGSLVEAPALYPYLTGRENVRVMARYCGLPDSAVEQALDAAGMTAAADHRYSTYSLGMKQRMGVAVALLKRPELLVLDEPGNGLDPEGTVEMRRMLRRYVADGGTVFLSSHLLGEVQQVCDRVAIIQQGRLLQEGTVDELRGGPSMVVRATPQGTARTILAGLVGDGAVTTDDGTLKVAAGPERAAEINRALVTGGVDVTELRPAERSLEEVFLQVTGEEEA